ncbi:5-methylcytosine-specific restriction endonuclease McrA [Streptomyces sp. SAI-208]|uniref:HNH endonuclease n=1 Tax=Streptomyces sp. SAI-208 TaxID=2940550 RepID=UPI0024771F33|nr:HNH endonuclease signature motif containing protein [Streptomyces sp. SAI-208]MDH6610249.1 5-methylcytosine-specific restriction endonuclease McrA [Streptomyces sp. SAI-208]
MPRIRTVKPEFWEDELLGVMPRDARLLFIATFNMADDEGILRWTPAYIKAQAFMYDDDLTIADVGKLMQCLTDSGLVFPYIGGVARQQMAVVVNFRKHQRINRPQKSKLVPPSLGNWQVRAMYARRDGWICQLCGGGIPEKPVSNDSHNLSIDHIRPVSAGGTDHPSNVRAAHQACNKSRRDTPDGEEFIPPRSLAGLEASLSDALNRSRNHSVNDSVNESHANVNSEPPMDTEGEFSSLNHSLMEGKGREGNREGKGNPPTPRDQSGQPAVTQTGGAIEDRMTDAFMTRFRKGNSYRPRQVRQTIADALANQADPDELWAAMTRLGELSKPVSAGSLQFAFSEIRQQQLDNVRQLRPSTATVRWTEGQALAAKFRAEEQRALEAARSDQEKPA